MQQRIHFVDLNTTTGLLSAARSRARWKIRKANQPFGFADAFVEQFRPPDGQEHALDMGFGRTDRAVAIRIVTTLAQGRSPQGLGDHRLCCCWRAVQQHALRRLQIIALKQRNDAGTAVGRRPLIRIISLSRPPMSANVTSGVSSTRSLSPSAGSASDGEADGRIDDNTVAPD